ncbi:hypothetical protein ES703_71714 [subsurface metagenome]
MLVTVTVKVTFSPGGALSSLGEIETSTPPTTALAMQLALSLISAFSVDVAVTVILLSSPGDAFSGILTVSVAVLFSPSPTFLSRLSKSVGLQFSLSLTVRS